MKNRKTVFLVAALTGALAACGALEIGPRSTALNAGSDRRATGLDAAAGVKANVDQAFRLLVAGEYDRAQGLLEKIVDKDSDNVTARKYLDQLRADPEDLLRPGYFMYRLEKGDTMTTVAERFLGDYRKFVSLARANHISRPNAVRSGDSVKVPVDRLTAMARRSPTSRPAHGVASQQPADANAVTLLPAATRPVAPQPLAARAAEIPQRASGGGEGPATAALGEQLAGPPVGLMATVEGENPNVRLAEPEAASDENVLSGGASPKVDPELVTAAGAVAGRRDPARSGNMGKAEHLYEDGLSFLESEDPERAYGAFAEAIRLDPDHEQAERLLASVGAVLADRHYWQGMLAYHQRDFEEALAHFETSLRYDPGHEEAETYRARALAEVGTPARAAGGQAASAKRVPPVLNGVPQPPRPSDD